MNRSIGLLIGILLLFFSIVAACSNQESANEQMAQEQATESSQNAGLGEETNRESEVVDESSETVSDSTTTIQEVDTSERMIIYNGNLKIEVENVDHAQQQIQERLEHMGGYIVDSTVHDPREGNGRNAALTVRVPQENFDPFLNEMESASIRVIERTTHGNDVTEEYIDLESRLRSKEVVEERLLSFVEKSENTEDLLKISQDLASTQEEIERLKGRMNYLENHVAYATVTIHMNEVAVSSIQNQDSLHTWTKAKSLFMDTVNVIISFLSGMVVFLIGLSPVLIPLLTIGAGIIFFRKRIRNEKTD